MQFVRTGGGNNGNLGAVPLAVCGRVSVGHDIELSNRIDPEKLAAGAAGSDVDKRSARIFDAV